jgi:REP element-mobilizing transposase RayT
LVFYPLAYHITFGTYGTRLHGDSRGTVDRSHNVYGEPIVGRAEDWHREELAHLKFPARVFTREQMVEAEGSIPSICVRGGWSLHACAAGPDHVHVVCSAEVAGKAIRTWLKRWLGEGLAERWALAEGETFWAEAGSVKWVWTTDYFERVVPYVIGQRATGRGK